MPFVIPYPHIDPAIFSLHVFGITLSLRWYALAYIAGLVLGWRLMVWLMRRPALWPHDKAPMRPEEPEELLTWMVLAVILGGRTGYVLFYDPAYFFAHPAQIPQVWHGGMSFHGGFIGVILAATLFARRRGVPLAQLADAVALATPAGLFFGRIANFINDELWGRVTDVPWAMVFPGAGPLPRHPSQLYEAGLEGIALGTLLWWLALRRHWLRWPGAITGMFFLGYGCARSFVENFRQWDPQVGYVVHWNGGGLTMGQVLSLPMIAIGLVILWYALRRRAGAHPDQGQEQGQSQAHGQAQGQGKGPGPA